MNEKEIRAAFATLIAAAKKAASEAGATPKNAAVIDPGMRIIEQLCVDVHRIADAVEILAGNHG